MKNPEWKREELILALDLYFKMDYGQMHGKNPRVIKLSEDLRQLRLHTNIAEPEKFRSVNSVSLKLANFKKLDQNFSGEGMRDGGKMDREVWNEFHRHRDSLKQEAEVIRHLYLKHNPVPDSLPEVENKAFYSAEFLYEFHKNRETDPLLIRLKREQELADAGYLQCEVCGFDSVAFYGELGADLLEIHYSMKSEAEPQIFSGSMEDFQVVCSNCHKILDKHFGLITQYDLKKIISQK